MDEENPECGNDCGGSEKLTNISDGDEAVFRYIKSDKEYCEIQLAASGSGLVEVWMNETLAGSVTVEAGVQQNSEIRMEAGEYELRLVFREADGLEIREITVK
ncbi:MAG: hypothetical protein MSA90_01855 [Faecalicatena sp.]|uniref:hypothetical protein n=1 Tax=Faecalicatena sp. TaxID=2005360 RepID=UPI002586F640|nr:hypothetical protein [Faecalicatena sp.]MCI6464200.1 hypothetical protein [Faecalicatena sp.]MDY5621166.1 hypothetical protein [Lachnospiraceae bacterium]